jgi:hypothetical protein
MQDGATGVDDVVGKPDRWTRYPAQSNVAGEDVLWSDAAAVLLDELVTATAAIEGIGVPTDEIVLGPDELKGGIALQKSGRTTALTQGKLVSLNTSVKLGQQALGSMAAITYLEQAIVEATDGTLLADAGDSGALVLDGRRRAAGVLVGSTRAELSQRSQMIVTPIRLAIGDLNHQAPGTNLSQGTARRRFVLVTGP